MASMNVAQDYPDTREGWGRRWTDEFTAAKKFFKPFHKESERVVKRFIDERDSQYDEDDGVSTRLNLFNANITSLQSMLYGRVPKAEVMRKFTDANDDVARVASLIMERLINTDIQYNGQDYTQCLRNVLEDRLVPGLGTARVRYDFQGQDEQVPPKIGPDNQEQAPGYTKTNTISECVEFVYTYWKDVLWSPCRTFEEMRWRAYRSYMTKDQFTKRFDEKLAERVPFSSKGPVKDESNKVNAWMQVEVWEIWNKEDRKVYYFIDGFGEILEDPKQDPLKLNNFFPEPRPMVANTTTGKFLPRADYAIAKDLYKKIDELDTRINMLTDACKVVGVYDKKNEDIGRMLTPGMENQLVPVDNWAAFAEKGGLKGTVDWLPLDQIVKAIDVLQVKLEQRIQMLYEVTGMADILRGSSQPRVTAAAEKIKSQYASIRVQRLQDEFAQFASDLLCLKAEIISNFYDPETIINGSNILYTVDKNAAGPAVQLIKSPQMGWRIQVKPETLAMIDYAQLKQDRVEYINALALFMQSSAPIIQQKPETAPYLMEMLKWGLAGFKGSQEIEGVIDQGIASIKQSPANDKPDPQVQKLQMEMQKSQQEHGMEMQKMTMEHKLEMFKQSAEHQSDMQQMATKQQLEIQKMQMDLYVEMRKQFMKMQADINKEKAQLTADVIGGEHAASLDMGSESK